MDDRLSKRSRAPRHLREAGSVPSTRTPARWWCIALALSVVVAYANGLRGPFFVDDIPTIVDNASIHDWLHVRDIFAPSQESPVASRPLVGLSFALNYALAGEIVHGYHVWNIATHVAAVLLLFGVVRRVLEQRRFGHTLGARATPIAFAVALVWAVHPLNTEAVDYVTQRTESMMGAFYLATLYSSLRAIGRPSRRWAVVAVACCAAGMACKESMVTAPIAVLLIDVVFVFASFHEALRARWRLYVALATTWILLAALVAFGPPVRSAGFATQVSAWTYLLNQTVMLVRYLRLAIWPTALVINYGWPLPLGVRDVWPQALIVTTLLILTIVAVWRWPAPGFLGAWFFLTLAPTSSVMPIATEVGAERRMYLPLIALVALVVVGAVRAWDQINTSRRQRGRPALAYGPVGGWLAVGVVAVALTLGTIGRNGEYGSAVTLAATTLDRWPSSQGEHLLGIELLLAGNQEEAVRHFERAVPGAPRAYYNLATVKFRAGEWDAAIHDFQAFLQAEPLRVEAILARLYLAQAFERIGRWADAIEECQQVLTMHPSRDDALDAQLFWADALRNQEAYAAALAQYQSYVTNRPTDVRGVTGMAVSFAGLDRADEAVAWFQRAADLTPDDGATQRNAAMALLDLHEVDAAAVYAGRAVRLRPDDAEAHDLLGQILFLQRQVPAAMEEFVRALQLNPGATVVREHVAHARLALRSLSGSQPPQINR